MTEPPQAWPQPIRPARDIGQELERLGLLMVEQEHMQTSLNEDWKQVHIEIERCENRFHEVARLVSRNKIDSATARKTMATIAASMASGYQEKKRIYEQIGQANATWADLWHQMRIIGQSAGG